MSRFISLILLFVVCSTDLSLPAAAQHEGTAHRRVLLAPDSLRHGLNNTLPDGHFTTRKDSLVFFPAAFNLRTDAKLYDLLKVLPGMENRDGALYWQDKALSVVINHNSTFNSNGILGLIPCSIIDEIIIYNCASDLTEQSGRSDQEEDYTLSLQISEKQLQKWRVHIQGGFQTPNRYEGETDVMQLDSRRPVMGFFNANNINKATTPHCFLDASSEIDLFGRQEYGALAYQQSWKGKREAPDGKHLFNMAADHTTGWGNILQQTEDFLFDNSSNLSLEDRDYTTRSLHPTLYGEIKWYANPLNKFTLKTEVDVSRRRTLEDIKSALFSVNPLADSISGHNDFVQQFPLAENCHRIINQSIHHDSKRMHQTHLSLEGIWTRRFHSFRELEITASVDYLDGEENEESSYDIQKEQVCHSVVVQQNSKPQHQIHMAVNAFYKQWITAHCLFAATYRWSKKREFEKQLHYESDLQEASAPPSVLPFDADNSYQHIYSAQEHLFDGALVFNYRRISLLPRLKIALAHEKAFHKREGLDTLVRRNQPIFTPSVECKWKINASTSASCSYHLTTLRPNLLDIIPWLDDTNPLWHIQGNNRLRSTPQHRVTFYLRANVDRTQTIVKSKAVFTHLKRPITSTYFYDIQNSTYLIRSENTLHPTYGLQWENSFRQYLSRYWNFNLDMEYLFENRDGYLTSTTANTQLKSNRQHIAVTTLHPTLSYDNPQSWKCSVYSLLVFTHNQYKGYAKNYHHLRQYDFGIQAEKKLGHVLLQTHLHDVVNKGYLNPKINGHHLLWSLTAYWYCCKDRGVLKIHCDDILNHSLCYERTILPQQHTELYKDKLHHFIHLSFSYAF